MENNRGKKVILNILKLAIVLMAILDIALIGKQINKINSKGSEKVRAEVERQTEVPEGYIGITTAEELKNIANDLTANYILMADIDMTGEEWTPVGSFSAQFTGTFDGNLYTISNLSIQSANQCVGMFGHVNGGTIKNLTLENENVTSTYTTTSSSSYSYVGGLVGYGANATIENVTLENAMVKNIYTTARSSNPYIGGLVGYNTGALNNITVSGKVSGEVSDEGTYAGNLYIGGIIGYNTGALTNLINKATVENLINMYTDVGGIAGYNTANISNSSNMGNINVSSENRYIYAGGLVGYNVASSITNSYNIGNITVTGESKNEVGGAIGYAQGVGSINKVYTTGNVIVNSESNDTYVGGLIGYTYAYATYRADLQIKDIYSTSNITLTNGYAGGLVGYTKGNYDSSSDYQRTVITNGYAIGKIEGGTTTGGIVGYGSSIIVTNSYWSPETTGQYTSATTGEKARLFQTMLYQNNYISWDFDTIWQIEEGESLPYLRDMDKPETVNKTGYTYLEYEGTGTEEDPYLIKTAEQLQGINKQVDSIYYKLANDIEWDSSTLFEPIANSTTPFTGTLDGANYKITGLKIESANQYVGMFGYISGGSIKNLTLENATVTSTYTAGTSYVGGLVGYGAKATIENVTLENAMVKSIYTTASSSNPYIGGLVGYNTGALNNITVSGKVSGEVSDEGTYAGNLYIGGIIGYNTGALTNLINKATVENLINMYTDVGGIAGYNTANISNSSNMGNINVSTENRSIYAGGLVGRNISGSITNSYNIGNITVTGDGGNNVGGAIGYAQGVGSINKVYTTGNVIVNSESNGTYVGGLIGYAYATASNRADLQIKDIYSTSNITLTNGYAGGLVGYAKGNYDSSSDYQRTVITNGYAIGKIEGGTTTGGIVGYGSSIIVTNSYWSPETTGQYTSATTGEKARLFQTMLYQNNYISWDFDTIWQIEEGESLPYLRDMDKPETVNKTGYTYIGYEGKGTEEDPYLIKTAEQLQGMQNEPASYYELENDIEWDSNTLFEPIGNSTHSFTGTLEGNNHKITGLNIESANQYVGMFGYVNGGTVKNVTIENITVTSTYTTSTSEYPCIGGLAGYNQGTIENVTVNGNVNYADESVGALYVGGLTGRNTGTITISYNTANISANLTTGTISAGGLAGINNGTISNSYSLGNITTTATTGAINVGGLVGYRYNGNITNTYAIGKVSAETTGTIYQGGLIGRNGSGTVTSSYWSPETTGQYTSATTGEKAKLLNSMLHQDTFENWDFETIWQIEEGETLPYLRNMDKPETVNISNYTYTEYEGKGTEENPYLIKTAEQLQSIKNELNAYYKLANDIDWDSSTMFEPIGNYTTRFTGNFDGNNHKITELNIESSNQYVGMFGYVNGGMIKNLTLENAMVTSTYTTTSSSNSYVGGLVGYNNGTLNNITVGGEVSNEGSVAGSLYIGGIVGYNTGTSTNLVNKATVGNLVNVATYIGGIAGYNTANISNSYNIGNINVTTEDKVVYVGGLTGQQNAGTISTCYNAGNVTATSTIVTIYAGGLVGYKAGLINNSYNIGSTTATSTSGAIFEGGLVGYNYSGNVVNTYAVGKVITTTTGTINVGGLVGYNRSGTATSSYWSQKSTGQETSKLGTEKTTQELLYQDAYENWDFDTIWAIEPDGESLAYLQELEEPEGVLKEEVIYETKVTVLKTDAQGNPLPGASFIVKNEAGETVREGVSDYRGKYIIGDIEAGIYTVVETEAPISYIKDTKEHKFIFTEDSKIYDIREEMELQNIVVENKSLEINITTVDKETKEGIEGVTIGLFDSEKNAIIGIDGKEVKVKSVEEGLAVLTKMPAGTYIYKEIEPATGYRLNDTEYTVTITEDGTVTFGEENNGIIENEKILLNVTITKKAIDTEVPLEGATIGLYNSNGTPKLDEEGNHIVKTTDEDGQVTFENLEVGTYRYREITAPTAYEVNINTYTFTVNQNETITYGGGNEGIIYDTLKTGTIVITKRAEITNMPLKGAVIALYDRELNIMRDEYGVEMKASTNKQGVITFTGLQPGTYYYIELKAPTGYKLNSIINKVVINEDFTVEYEFHNGTFYNVAKKNYRIGIKLNIGTVGGRTITIRHSDGTTYTKTTSSSGAVSFSGLSSGTYYYTLDGDDTEYTFTINTDGSVSYGGSNGITIQGSSVTADVTLKTGKGGTTVKLYDGDGNAIYGEDGNQVSRITDENGNVVFEGIEPGSYLYQVGDGEERYGFIVDDDGNIKYISATGKIITDVTITIYKSGTTTPLSGFVLGLYDENGSAILGSDGKHITVTTGSNGIGTFAGIEPGNYRYKVISAPSGYLTGDNSYGFIVGEDGSVTYENGIATIEIEIETIDIAVTKEWVDTEAQRVHRPANIKVQVLNGETVVQEKTISSTESAVTFTGLPKYDSDGNEISYTIAEAEVENGELKYYVSTINGNVITNTFTVPTETIDIAVTKEWVDNGNSTGVRPQSVIIIAKRGDTEGGQIELTQDNATVGNNNIWEGKISNLPKYDSDGNEIIYSIDEKEANSGDLSFYKKTIEGNKIINTLTVKNAAYKVEHYRRSSDIEVESYTCETEYFEAKVGEEVTAIPKEYEGFVENTLHPNRIATGIVTEDGLLVLRLYYDREQYNISYELNGGRATGILTRTYRYGQEIYLSKRVAKAGYEFAGWYDNSNFEGDTVTKIEIGESGNKTFYAKWIQPVISSEIYTIDEVKNQISGIDTETSANMIIENLGVPEENVKIHDLYGNEVSSDSVVGTGYTIVINNGQKTYEYQIAVTGDLDGNGKVTITDLSMLNQQMVKRIELNEIQKTAIDIDQNGKVSITDLSMMNKYLVKKK